MAIGRVVPWISWEEWTTVHGGLFAANIAQQRAALRQVALWRCRGKVPLAVDVTGCLTEIGIRDQSRNSDTELSETIRLEYSMTLVRMVNGISDKAQKGKTATSVSSNAAAAGLPRLLVDVRHEASHNEMPSLPLLRLAAAQALDWLQTAYWQRQEAHLQMQHHRVIQLLQEFVALKVGRELQPKSDLPSGHAAALSDRPSQTAAATSSSSKKQKASIQAEHLHQQQAVLNQLKELPVKSMNASLLVSPLLDHDLHAHLHGIVSALAAVWPSLPAVLLSGAVQRLCSKTHDQQAADDHLALLTAVMETLLQGHSMPDAQQQLGPKKRRGKRKSTGSDAEPANAAGLPIWCASGAQLKACIADCLEAQPTAEGKRAAALHSLLLLLVQQLKEEHAAHYATWGSNAEQLANLAFPASDLSQAQQDISQKAAASTQNSSALAEPSSDHVSKLQKRQKQMLQNLAARDENVPRASRVWGKAVDWIPCAIGALPSVADQNGRLPTFAASQSETADACPLASVTQPHASPMAFAVQSANPGQGHNLSAEAADDSAAAADPNQQILAPGHTELSFTDYWQGFDALDMTDVHNAVQDQALIPQGKTVKVL